MNLLLLTDDMQGAARNYLAKIQLQEAAQKQNITLVNTLTHADRVLFIGSHLPDEKTLEGKFLTVADYRNALLSPAALIENVQKQIKPYQHIGDVPNQQTAKKARRVVAVTACPTGVAHTFMAAEAITLEAKKRGWWIKVETHGSVGTGNALSAEEIAQADLVIVAADIDVDLDKFAGKPLYRTTTGMMLKKTSRELDNALNSAEIYQPVTSGSFSLHTPHNKKRKDFGVYRHLLTGVSYMLPIVVAGGLCIALSLLFGLDAADKPGTLAAALKMIGDDSALSLMVPVLAGYIAFSIADRPGLTPGLIGGMLAVSTDAGFLGGIIAGFLAGYIARFINNRLKLPQNMEALKPILIIPLVASLITGLVMIYVVGTPVAKVLEVLEHWLNGMGTTNALILGTILGAMMCTDLGGPVNKVAYAFGVALLSTKNYTPMAAVMAAGMVPPLAMAISTFLARNKFSPAEREGGKAAFILGLCFISEGAIPFAARDPLRVLPCCIFGGAITGALSMAFGVKLMAPHGGLFVLLIPGAITPVLYFMIAILAGTLSAGILYAILKRPDIQVAESHNIVAGKINTDMPKNQL